MVMGGGLFLPATGGAMVGACRIGTGIASGSGAGEEVGVVSCSALKFRFLRIGLTGLVAIIQGKRKKYEENERRTERDRKSVV